MPLTLYKLSPGPTARSILITGAAIGITFEEREVNLPHGQHIKIIPKPTLPALDDNGKILYDSHAINSYLIDKYAENHTLYPKDLYQRALVNQALAFDLGFTFSILVNLNQAYLKEEISCLTPQWINTIQSAYERLETMLQDKEWVALDHVTIGDFSCYTTITSLNYYLPIDSKKYPNIKNWMVRCQNLPYFETDSVNLKKFVDLMNCTGAMLYLD